jgi:hypothetical protein
MAASNTAELPGLVGVVDRLLLEAAACREDAGCREYVRTCVVGTILFDALMRLAAASKGRVPLEKLYEAVASQTALGDVLNKHRELASEMLDKTVKYLEMHGEIRNGTATRDALLKMAIHIETAMVFLGCWTA